MDGTVMRRVGATIALLLTTLLAVTGSAVAANTATITLHSRVCPAGQPTTDIFKDCHSHLPTQTTSYSFDNGTAREVGADGNLSVTKLTAGKHTIVQQEGVPLDFAHLRVFCSDTTVGTAAKEVTVNSNRFTVPAVAGDEVVCDVYTIPENASGLPATAKITLHSRVCPAGQPTTDIFKDCHGHAPTQLTSYSVDGGPARQVRSNGNVSFTDLNAGARTFAQEEGVPLDFAYLRVFCSDQTTRGAVEEMAVDVNTFRVTAVAGDEIVCDVYTIPENASGLPITGTITLHSRVCPAGQPTTDIFTDCHSHLPSQTTTYSLDGADAQAVGANGNLAFTDLATGKHTITQQEGVPLDFAYLRVFCSDTTVGTAAKEVTVNSNRFTVTAVAGDEVICDVYTIPENASGQ
jgi:hypothetical protein